MNKILCLLFVCILCSALIVTACSNKGSGASGEPADEVTEEAEAPDLAKMMIGKWIIKERDGKPTPTNQKAILTFISPETAYMSASFNELKSSYWGYDQKMDAVIDSNKVTLNRKIDNNSAIVDEVTVSEVTDTEMNGNLVVKKVKDGTEKVIIEQAVSFVKINEDYSKDIIGTWEGHRTSEEGDYDDGNDHRWEYKDDGTFVYYSKEGDKWTVHDQKISDYFVDGNLLCTRWEDKGEEASECWEITIDGEKMSWTATRLNDDDKITYTASFEMSRVKE